MPTIQATGIYRHNRGNPPDNTDEKEWIKAYNSANSIYYTAAKRLIEQAVEDSVNTKKDLENAGVTATAACELLRKEGKTRALAIKMLVLEGCIEEGFVDNNV